jgi:hypothetical protein
LIEKNLFWLKEQTMTGDFFSRRTADNSGVQLYLGGDCSDTGNNAHSAKGEPHFGSGRHRRGGVQSLVWPCHLEEGSGFSA